MTWRRTWRADPRAAALADEHYNRKSRGAQQFAPPGRCLVLLTLCDEWPGANALWVTSHQRYTEHGLGDVWMNTTFRRVAGDVVASEMIREALAATRAAWGDPPEGGTVSFVGPRKVRSSNPGYCYQCAGFERLAQRTKDRGLIIYRLDAAEHPLPAAASLAPRLSGQLELA